MKAQRGLAVVPIGATPLKFGRAVSEKNEIFPKRLKK